MGYTLCVLGVYTNTQSPLSIADYDLPLGCGTMGVAVTAGVLASLDSRSPLHGLGSGQPKWESHTPGTSTPTNIADDDSTLPSRFIACVKREESASCLREKFRALVGGEAIEVTVGQNVAAVQQSDVVLLWYACTVHPHGRNLANSLFQLQTTGGAPHSQRRWNQRSFGRKVAHQHPHRRHHRATLQLGPSQHDRNPCDAQRSMSRAFRKRTSSATNPLRVFFLDRFARA